MNSQKILSVIWRGFPNTLTLLIWSFIFATILGLALTWLDLRKNRFARGIATVYLNLVRGTPPLLMLLMAYYGLPVLLKAIGIDIDHWTRMTFGVLGLTLGWSGYLSEAFRSAYLSVDRGQIEAARSVGMPDRTTFWQIIIPQAAMIALPNIENLVVGLVKATSLVYVIGLYDLYNQASNLSNQTAGLHQLQIFVLLALTYWLLVLVIEALFRLIRRRYRQMI
ncbi:amino acid ABC superfamily ATP binding cassette transporter, membrane protein [Limosilactobacillus frumenti DSM 13145]|uniref:Amino acid ABC superfamily ATP binding cassette transporter, membrane protein n=1 Tax=Limosilactobacillus frumenti DSM 13145 TaxID=1423746 RepID=A0A0R1PDI4_9LACO|nr:amino acid ABC transporter permease [Limosilactobacillus frumenti]KRL27011.1 amino acid ABC superfamily ATP binding cassette transporter, membrane protein [Limosilactobacillus frumenti DSM 13145]MBA2914188.1 amino acid ABC transporter permease [Limosilactobacillus frumenti]QFG72487.1 amino acid ABC transporter permease [Limosilactobacillus frumenti]